MALELEDGYVADVDKPDGRPSLRERQRAEVRREIQQVATKLFSERGFDDVSIAEIAEASGVSQRTVYRHFATKEEVILSLWGDSAPLIQGHIRQHPPGDAPWKVLRDAFLAAAEAAPPIDHQVQRMMFETPRLMSAYGDRTVEWADRIADVLAERLGVDPRFDARPALWATMAMTIFQRANYEAVVLQDRDEDLTDVDEHFRQAEEFFSGQLP
jgi:AcrR family transcriptional regulator